MTGLNVTVKSERSDTVNVVFVRLSFPKLNIVKFPARIVELSCKAVDIFPETLSIGFESIWTVKFIWVEFNDKSGLTQSAVMLKV